MRCRIFLGLVPLLLALAAPAEAQRMVDGETLDRILPEIRAAHPGRLSDAEPWTDETGRTHYRIKWMTPEGRILYFDADARTGHYSTSGGEPHVVRDHIRGDDGGQPMPDDRGRHRDNFSDEPGVWPGDGGWHDWRGAGDWRTRHGGGDSGGWHHHEHGGH